MRNGHRATRQCSRASSVEALHPRRNFLYYSKYMVKNAFAAFKRFDKWADQCAGLLALLLILVIIRIPTLFEPYWYGDEAIYLTIGHALRHGEVLYRDIVDHKTPLIYLLAMVGNQAAFRALLILAMGVATVSFHEIARKFMDAVPAWLLSLVFVIVTALPALEGNIPNGELFVIAFVLPALALTVHLPWLKGEKDWGPRQQTKAFGVGLLLGMAVLTKVPAVFDAAAVLAWPLFLLVAQRGKKIGRLMARVGLSLAGLVTPIIASILIFIAIGAGQDYLDFGLLYNFRYTGNWQLPFDNPAVLWLFSTPGKMIILTALGLAALIVARVQKQAVAAWAIVWLVAAGVASFLSNRPYPHYVLQIVPPLLFLVAAVAASKAKRFWTGINIALVGLYVAALVALGFKPYPLFAPYVAIAEWMTGRISTPEYQARFNHLVPQNQKIGTIIARNTLPSDTIFIWGTNPMLTALTGRRPTGRFTVAFHIHDLRVYESTLQAIRDEKPVYIVVMKDEAELPGLNEILEQYYPFVTETEDMRLYRRSERLSFFLQS